MLLWHPTGTQNLELAPILLENVCTRDLSTHCYVKQDDTDESVAGYSTSFPQNRQEVHVLTNEISVVLQVSMLSTTILEFTIIQITTHTRHTGSYITSDQHSLL
jgi:hypothetical protein